MSLQDFERGSCPVREQDAVFLEYLLNVVHEGIWVTDAADRFIYFNQAMEDISGVRREDILGLCLTTDFPEKMIGHFLPQYMRAKKSLQPNNYEADVLTPGGRQTIQQGSLTPRIEDGRFNGMICTVQDVTHVRSKERALLETGQRARRYLDIAPTIILALDKKGNITLLNKAGAHLLACPIKQALGQNWFDSFLPEDARGEVREVFDRLMQGDTIFHEHYESPIQTLDGRVLQVHWYNTLLRDRAGHIEGTLSSGEDITEHKRIEHERMRMQKRLEHMRHQEALGLLAGGVAHHFNNMLTTIMGSTELCLEDIDPDHPARAWLNEINEASRRAAKMIQDLLAFASKQMSFPQAIDLNPCLHFIIEIFRCSLEQGPVIAWKPAPQKLCVRVDPAQVQNVMGHLLRNAVQATGTTGHIEVQTEEACARNPYTDDDKENRYACIRVTDHGSGMSEEALAHLFEPFFSTREVGEGNGLGLPIALGIMKQSNGFIRVHSTPGEGCEATLFFPLVDATECEERLSSRTAAAGDVPDENS